MDIGLVLGGFAVGIVVGLTGMGGGALMTPMLVFFFGVSPLAAVSSDLVAAAVMKPFGGAVHAVHKTVNWRLVGWLALGGVPSGFVGALLLRVVGKDSGVDSLVLTALGVALLLAAFGLIVKAYLTMTRRRLRASDGPAATPGGLAGIGVRPIPTVLIGVVGGLVVGMTSVGSGSIMIIALLLLYPTLQSSQLVGTDLVQAVPLVAAAALGHLFFGDFHLDLAATLLLGSVPGTVIGALVSTRTSGGLVRRALALVLLASGLKLLGVSTPVTAVAIVACLVLGPVAWMVARRRNGLPASHFVARRLQKANT
ncbi:MAG: sulfite exporter TauE/SafE family protein [Pseudonocardia sp.]|nr:sulfite exporter TauE/SafE family protein [Pseudonocardia sp.]